MRKHKIFALDTKAPPDVRLIGAYLNNEGALPECKPDGAVLKCTPGMLLRAQQEMEDLFRHANCEHPVMQTLQQLCIERRARRMAGGL